MRGSIVTRPNKRGKSYYLVVGSDPDSRKQKWVRLGDTKREADSNANRILKDFDTSDLMVEEDNRLHSTGAENYKQLMHELTS